MQTIAFDESTAAELARMPGFTASGVVLSNADPLTAAFDARRESVLVLPGSGDDEALFVHLSFPARGEQAEPEHTVKSADPQPEDQAPVSAGDPPAKNSKPKSDSHFPATGFLGLEGDAVYLDEIEPEKKWWQRIFGK